MRGECLMADSRARSGENDSSFADFIKSLVFMWTARGWIIISCGSYTFNCNQSIELECSFANLEFIVFGCNKRNQK